MNDPHDINWFSLDYLLAGTPRQQSAAKVLLNYAAMEKLSGYSPVLCGTVPIDCDLPGSDLDIICYAPDPAAFLEHATREFNGHKDFSSKHKELFGVDSAICRFELGDWPVEIVAQPLPVQRQRAYGHMLAEALLLFEGTGGTNDIIRALKRRGLSTEEAFASHFGLPGDPYETLFHLYQARFCNG